VTDDDPDPETDEGERGPRKLDDGSDAPELDGDRERPELDSEPETPELPGETEDARSGPLGDLAGRVDKRRGDEPDAEFDDLFEDTGGASVDSDALWEQVGAEGTLDDGDGEAERRVVEKRTYCQSCKYFSEPPDVACTHRDTEILEVVDADRFEVFNCPVVRENDELENL
jgi:hypothetical protein